MATYYIDPERLTNGVGTQVDPFNVLPANFSSAGFVNGDEFLIKCGTRYEPAWSGSPGDCFTVNRQVRIASYGTGDKPIVSGQYSGSAGGKLFRVYTSGCVIEHIAIEDMVNAHAIYVQSGIADFTARYNRIRRIRGTSAGNEGGIIVGTSGALTGTVIVSHNEVEDICNDCIEVRCTGTINLEWNLTVRPSLDTDTGDCMAVVGNCADLQVRYNYWNHANKDTKQLFIQDGGSTGAAVIEYNRGVGFFGAGSANHTGIYLSLPGVIRRNRIRTWRSQVFCAGVDIEVTDNIIECGAGSAGTGAVYGSSAGMTAEGNTIVVIEGVDVTDAAIRNNTSDASNVYRNNCIVGFACGIRKGALAVESNNNFFDCATSVRNASYVVIAADGTDVFFDPRFTREYAPGNEELEGVGTYIAGDDVYGMPRANPPTIGAVEYQAALAARALPRLLYDNRLTDATPTASTTETDYDVANLGDLRLYSFWKPTALPATITVDCATATAADFAAICGHDLYTSNCWVEIRGSTDNFSASDVLLIRRQPTSDQPFILPFDSAEYRYWRIRIEGSEAPTLAIALIGEAFPIPRQHQLGFDPTARSARSQTNRSVSGYPLGKVTTFEEWAQSVSIDIVTWAWIRDSWIPAWKEWLRDEPFLYAWDSTDHPAEVYLVTAGPDFKTPTITGNYAGLEFTLTGVAT